MRGKPIWLMLFPAVFLAVSSWVVFAESSPFVFHPDVFSHYSTYRGKVDLNGTWELRRDPKGVGEIENWQAGKTSFPDRMRVPGAPQAQGIGEPHSYQRTCFSEPFWIRRRFDFPPISSKERVWLRLGGILPAAEVYLNGTSIGATKSSRTQQRVDVTSVVHFGDANLIAIKVLPFPEVRLDGLFEWNQGTQLWSGPYRPITLEIAHEVSVLDLYLEPDLARKSLVAGVRLSKSTTGPLDIELTVKDRTRAIGSSKVRLSAGESSFRSEVALSSFVPWSPNHPKLYTLEIASFEEKGTPVDRIGFKFGMREIETRGTRFYLNGNPLFLRVYGEDHYYPETLSPPAEKAWYLERLKRARAYGFNAVKGCVDTIPQDYLEACDEAGILIIQEMPFGLSTLRANRYTINATFREYYSNELEGLIRVSRNHASVVAYSMSSELTFREQTQESFNFFSQDLVRRTRQLAPHALVIDCTGYVASKPGDFIDSVSTVDTQKGKRDTDFYTSFHPGASKEVLDESDMRSDGEHPTILHEYNWWSSYPDPGDREKYASAQLLPFWLDRLEKTARANGQADLIPTYRNNSLWLQALCRKDGVEYARRNAGVEGFILWLLVDFGHWSEGLFDDFWNPKNVTAEEFLKSNADTVVILAEEGDRCLAAGRTAEIPFAISHYGEEDLGTLAIRWKATGGPCLAEGRIAVGKVMKGEFNRAGSAVFEFPRSDQAYKVDVEVKLEEDGAILNTNDWSFWAFPETRESVDKIFSNKAQTVSTYLTETSPEGIPPQTEVLVADHVDSKLLDFLESGGKVLLFPRDEVVRGTLDKTNDYGTFRTIPWNRGDSGNSGTVIAEHPALKNFPHEGFCDLPFLHLVKDHLPLGFEPLRKYGVEPIIRNIDHYYSNRNLAYLLEFQVGDGKVLVSTLGVLGAATDRIEARYLLERLVAYYSSGVDSPTATVPRSALEALLKRAPE